MAKILANLKGLEHAEQLGKRLCGIGGSEAAAACGLDKYMSKLELWARKTGRWDPESKHEYDPEGKSGTDHDNDRTRLGRDLEQYIAERFSEITGKELRVPEAMYSHDEYGFAIANLDREIVGENAALECATANFAFEKMPENVEELPVNISAQCWHYLAVMRFERIYLALLDLFSGKLRIFEIPYDEEKCGALLNCERRFWNDHVLAGKAPKPDGSDSALEALKRLTKPLHGEPIDLKASEKSVEELYGLRKKIKELESREKTLRSELIALMNGNSRAFSGKFQLDFSKQSRKIVDQKLLKEKYAEIFDSCLKDSTALVLKITEI